MVSDLPGELLEQAKLLLTLPPNQANLRRAVSAAYYGLFHLLIRAAALKWNDPPHQARIARLFEHERMKKVSGETIKRLENQAGPSGQNFIDIPGRSELTKVAQSFIVLQQARHLADYNLEMPLDRAKAAGWVDSAESAFTSWEIASESEVAKEYLFCLLFKEKERT